MTNDAAHSSELSALRHYTVDSFDNGVAIGHHRMEREADSRDLCHLRLGDDESLLQLRSRYALHTEKPYEHLESHLARLSKQGVLRSSVIHFGVTSDPFFPFDGKFNASMKFLQLFERYTPGLLIVQTRSPLAVIAMPVFKRLGKHITVTIGLETHLEESVRQFTPGLPRVEERLKMATALRRLGVEVTLQVSPVLPYGDWRSGAGEFAQVLTDNADFIHILPLTDGSEKTERRIKTLAVAKRLAAERKFHWLRPDSANPLITEVERRCPEKLLVPVRNHLTERQLKIFAA